MQWLNLNVSVLDSPEFVGSEPVDRATWLCLQRYCVGQENGGVIENCKTWGDRKWQQLCRVTAAEADRNCALFWWEGENLAVFAYPKDKEDEIRAKRESAQRTNQARKSPIPRLGMEENRIEGKGRGASRSAERSASRSAERSPQDAQIPSFDEFWGYIHKLNPEVTEDFAKEKWLAQEQMTWEKTKRWTAYAERVIGWYFDNKKKNEARKPYNGAADRNAGFTQTADEYNAATAERRKRHTV
jgi:hypothetical protein